MVSRKRVPSLHAFTLVTAAFTLVVMASTLGVASAQDKPAPVEPVPFSYISPDVRAKMEAQRPLVEAASRIQNIVDAGATDGYAGVVLDEDHVTVWWKGGVPAAVRDTIAEVQRTTPVKVAPAVHSRAELESAAEGIAAYMRVHPDGPYYGTMIAYDGSGLTIQADSTSVGPKATTLPAEITQATAEVPVTVTVAPRPALAGRLDDTPYFWAGGRMNNNDNNSYCTAGWPVLGGDGYRYMLTAGHCGRPGGSWNNGNDTQYFGMGVYEHLSHDLLLVRALTAGRMFDGGVGSGEFTKRVAGSDHAFPGEWVCSSGSVGGARCWYQVTAVFQHTMCFNDVYGNRECYDDLVLARWDGAGPPLYSGDSGGPVFVPVGTGDVIAKGTMTGYWYEGQGRYLVFQDFITAQRDFGISIITG